MDDERFDGLYLNVAQTTRGIEPLLDTVFSFLRRKTDFFSGPPGAEDGTAAAISKVNEVMQKHADQYKNDKLAAEKKKQTKQQQAAASKKPKPSTKTTKPKAAAVAQQPVTETTDVEEIIEMSNDGGFDASIAVESEKPVISPLKATRAKESSQTEEIPPSATTTATPPKTTHNDDDKKDDDGGEGPAPEGNGGTVAGKYAWTQTLSELVVNVPVPQNTRGRDVQVVITPSHLKIALKKNTPDVVVVVDADLTKRVVCDDSFWTIEDGNRLVVNLQKTNEMEWWESVCKGDPIINVRHIKPENSNLSDLDGDTRKTVEKMMFDQRQKALGRPTSDEQSKLDALDMFKKQHPEMDFSNAKVS